MMESSKGSKEKMQEKSNSVASEGNVGTLGKTTTSLWSARWSTSARKKRRNKPPPGYEDWSDEDKQYYQDVSTALRQWKASQVQCQLRRFTIGFWKHLKYQLKGHPMHAEEMKDYKKTLETFVVLKEDQSLDID